LLAALISAVRQGEPPVQVLQVVNPRILPDDITGEAIEHLRLSARCQSRAKENFSRGGYPGNRQRQKARDNLPTGGFSRPNAASNSSLNPLACKLCGAQLTRRRRRLWMRWLLPGSRRYRCDKCSAAYLKALWGWWRV